jgi:hypothetical protein
MSGAKLLLVTPPEPAAVPPASRAQVAAGGSAPKTPQIRLTRALARAMAKQQRAEALLRAATAEVDAAFGPWAAGRSVSQAEAREQLTSTGFLPPRRIWE